MIGQIYALEKTNKVSKVSSHLIGKQNKESESTNIVYDHNKSLPGKSLKYKSNFIYSIPKNQINKT